MTEFEDLVVQAIQGTVRVLERLTNAIEALAINDRARLAEELSSTKDGRADATAGNESQTADAAETTEVGTGPD